MDTFTWNNALLVFSVGAGVATVRYLVMSGIGYFLFWRLLFHRLQHRWIQEGKVPDPKKIQHEIRYSLLTMLFFGGTAVFIFYLRTQGWTQIYLDFSAYGWGYFFLSLVGLILLHDAYFYWGHRIMHHPLIFKKVHLVHHVPTNPSPWAAFAFHPWEAIIETGIVPLAVVLFPLHPATIVVFLLYMTFLNVLGHLGFEMFPKGFLDHPVLRLHNTTTHHNMHHRYFNCNYGLYFNWWDLWMGTNHPNYKQQFDGIHQRKPADSMALPGS